MDLSVCGSFFLSGSLGLHIIRALGRPCFAYRKSNWSMRKSQIGSMNISAGLHVFWCRFQDVGLPRRPWPCYPDRRRRRRHRFSGCLWRFSERLGWSRGEPWSQLLVAEIRSYARNRVVPCWILYGYLGYIWLNNNIMISWISRGSWSFSCCFPSWTETN